MASSSFTLSQAHLLASQAQATQQEPTHQEEFECVECDYKTFRKSNLTQHVKTVHQRVKDFGCDRCEYRSARRSNVAYHIKTVHENVKDYECSFCNFKSARKYNVVQHAERVHKAEVSGQEGGIEQFIHHNKAALPQPQQLLVQNVEVAATGSGRKRKRGKLTQQPQPQPQILTLDPPTMVSTPSNYMTLNYQPATGMYTSGASQQQITVAPAVQQQPQQHQQQQQPAFTTMNFSSLQPLHYNQLQNTFSHASTAPSTAAAAAAVAAASISLPSQPQPAATIIKREQQQRSPPKDFACTFCPFKSTKKKNLALHLQSVHQANPVPQYPLQPPHQQPGTTTIVHHLPPANSASSLRTPSGRPKTFACNVCDFRSAYRRNLNAHVNEVHLRDRREHRCDACDFKTTRKSNLAQHIKSVHERVKDHACWLCGFTSTRKRNVEKHVLTMHVQKDSKSKSNPLQR